jgi:hypothetical protein
MTEAVCMAGKIAAQAPHHAVPAQEGLKKAWFPAILARHALSISP